MKPVIIAVAVLGALGAGAASFMLVRAAAGGRHGGAATREGLVAATIDGVNRGDREALLDIMVGPASDRVAAECDDVQDSEARDKHRADRVDDALDEAKRRKLVLDHIGDDHAEVVLKKGFEIDKHCTARVDVVKHQMEIALHDGKNIAYTAQLVGMEIAGRWYLATIPLAVPVGDKPAIAAAPPVATPAPTKAIADMSFVPPKCAAYLKQLEKASTCKSQPDAMRQGYKQALETMQQTLIHSKDWSDGGAAMDSTCQESLDDLMKLKLDC